MKHIFNFFWVLCIFHIVAFTACDNTATGNFENENVDEFSIFECNTYYGWDEYGNYLSSISFDDKDSKNCVFTLESENLSIPCKWTEKDSCATVTGTGEYSDISFKTTENTDTTFSVTFPIELCKKFNPNATTELVVHYNTNSPSYGEEDYAEIDLLAEETDKGVKFTFTIPNDSEKTITDITISRVDKNSGRSYDFIRADIPSVNYPEEINKGTITLYDYFVEPGEYVYRLKLENTRNGQLIYQSKNTPITVKNPGLYSDLEKVSLKLDSENCIDIICQFFQTPKEIDSYDVDNKEVYCVYKWLTKPTLTDSKLPNDINLRFSMKFDVDNPDSYSGFYVDYNSTENIKYWKNKTFTFIEGKYSVKEATLSLSYQEDVAHGEQTLNVRYQNQNGNEINIKDTILSQAKIDISQENINNAVSFNLGHSTDGNSINIETYNEENSSLFKQISHIEIYKSSNGKDYDYCLSVYPNRDKEEYFTGSVSVTDFFVTPGKEYSYICRLAVNQNEYVYDENGDSYSSENSGENFSIYSNIKTVTTDDNAETREINDIALTTADLSFDKYSKQYKWNAEPQITGIPEEILQDGYELKLNYKLNNSSIYLSYEKGDYSYPEIGSFYSYSYDGNSEDLEKGVYTLNSVSLETRNSNLSKADYYIQYNIPDSYGEALSLSFEDVALQTIDLTPYVPPFTIENTSEGVEFTITAEDDCTISQVRVYRTSADDSVEYDFSQNYSAVSEAVFYDPYVGNDKEYTYYCEVYLSTPNDYREWYTTEEKSIVVSGVTNPFDASCISVTKPELEFNAETMEYTWTTPPTVTTELPDDFVCFYKINYTYYINGDDAETSSFEYLLNYESNNNSFYLDSGYTASYKETCIILYDGNRRYKFTIPVDVIPDNLPQKIVGK